MTEQDQTTGQFISSEPRLGNAQLEHDLGYVPYKEEPKADEPDTSELTLEQATEDLTSRTPPSEIKTYSPLRDLPENMTVSLDQAVQLRAEARQADEAQAELEGDEQIRKEIDELRGTKPDAEVPSPDAEFDAKINEAIEPRLREADTRISEAETVKQTYSQAVDVAQDFARAAFIENFPEIAALPLDKWEGALAMMAQQEPARFQKALGTLQRVEQLQAARQQQDLQRAQQTQAEFQKYAQTENARFEAMTKGESKETMRAVEKEIPAMLAEYGADAGRFLEAISAQTTFPRAAAEKIMLDAAKYRLMMRAPKPTPAAKPLPAVQRPGVASASRNDSVSAQLRTLERQFASASGDKAIRIAAQMQSIKKAARTSR